MVTWHFADGRPTMCTVYYTLEREQCPCRHSDTLKTSPGLRLCMASRIGDPRAVIVWRKAVHLCQPLEVAVLGIGLLCVSEVHYVVSISQSCRDGRFHQIGVVGGSSDSS